MTTVDFDELTDEQFVALVASMCAEDRIPVPPVEVIKLARRLFDPHDGAELSMTPERGIRLEIFRPYDSYVVLIRADASISVCRLVEGEPVTALVQMSAEEVESRLAIGDN